MPVAQRVGKSKWCRIAVSQRLQLEMIDQSAAERFAAQDERVGRPSGAPEDQVDELLDGRVVDQLFDVSILFGKFRILAFELPSQVIDEQGEHFLLLHA